MTYHTPSHTVDLQYAVRSRHRIHILPKLKRDHLIIIINEIAYVFIEAFKVMYARHY